LVGLEKPFDIRKYKMKMQYVLLHQMTAFFQNGLLHIAQNGSNLGLWRSGCISGQHKNAADCNSRFLSAD